MKFFVVLALLIVPASLSSVYAEPVSCNSCDSCTNAISAGNSVILSDKFNYASDRNTCLTVHEVQNVTVNCNYIPLNASSPPSFLWVYSSKNIDIKNCDLRESASYRLVMVKNSEDIKISGSKFQKNLISGISMYEREEMAVLAISGSKRVSVYNNTFYQYQGWGVKIDSSEEIDVKNNLFDESYVGGGIELERGSNKINLENNRLLSAMTGIKVEEGTSSVNVIGNTFSKDNYVPLRLVSEAVFGLAIKGNSFVVRDNFGTLVDIRPLWVPSGSTSSTMIPSTMVVLLDLSGNYWGTLNCTKIRNSLVGSGGAYISPILSAPDGKEIQCPRNRRQTRTVFEYYSDSKILIAGLMDDSGTLYVNAPLTLVVGKHTLSETTDETGFVTIDLADEPELLESLAGGNAKVIFLGNSLLLPSEARLTINDFTPTGKCFSLRKGSAHNKINFVFVVPYEGEFKTVSAGYTPIKYTFFEKLKTGLIEKVIDPKGVSDGFGSIEPFKSNLEKFDFSLYLEWENPQDFLSYPDYFTHLNKIDGCKADRIIFLKPSWIRAYATGSVVSSVSDDYKKIDEVMKKKGYGVIPVTIVRADHSFNPVFAGGVRIFVHETGHLFGLMDEYIEYGKPDAPGYPNCAPDNETAQSWWGHLIGQGAGDLEVVPGGLSGCSYVMDNVRPNDNTAMNIQGDVASSDWEHGFGPVNEWFISEVLKEYK